MSASSRSLDTPPAKPPRGYPNKRTHITVACNACRVRKYKCNGDRPVCTGCQDRRTECVYDTDPDTTRTIALKRKQAALEEEVTTLRSLVTLIRESSQDEVDGVIEKLRQGLPVRSALPEAPTTSEAANDAPSSVDSPGSAQADFSSTRTVNADDSDTVTVAAAAAAQARKDQRMRISMLLAEEEASSSRTRAEPDRSQ